MAVSGRWKRALKRRQGLIGYPFHLLYYLWHKHDNDAKLRMNFLRMKFKILSVLHKKTKICNYENFYVYGSSYYMYERLVEEYKSN